jgi:hypothetical protein
MKNYFYTIIMIISFALIGCSDDFSPVAKLVYNYSVYSILDTRLDKQFVLVQKLYSDENSREYLTGAKVYLSESSVQVYQLKDTTISGLENYKVYYVPNCKLKRNITYRLTVLTDSIHTQWSDIYVEPSTNFSAYKSSRTYYSPYMSPWQETIYVISYQPISKICGVKMYIEYFTKSDPTLRNIEVPIDIRLNDTNVYNFNYEMWDYEIRDLNITYPKLENLQEETASSFSKEFHINFFRWALKKMVSDSPANVYIKRGFATYCTISAELFNILHPEKGEEAYSVRLDEPLTTTNFKSNEGYGIGISGAVTFDTASFKIIDTDLFGRLKYNDAQ